MFKIPMTVFQFFSNKYVSARESIFTSLVRKWKLYSMAFSMQRKRKWGKEGRKEGRQKEGKEERKNKKV